MYWRGQEYFPSEPFSIANNTGFLLVRYGHDCPAIVMYLAFAVVAFLLGLKFIITAIIEWKRNPAYKKTIPVGIGETYFASLCFESDFQSSISTVSAYPRFITALLVSEMGPLVFRN